MTRTSESSEDEGERSTTVEIHKDKGDSRDQVAQECVYLASTLVQGQYIYTSGYPAPE